MLNICAGQVCCCNAPDAHVLTSQAGCHRATRNAAPFGTGPCLLFDPPTSLVNRACRAQHRHTQVGSALCNSELQGR
eukprot:365542-Chlamydomonas_euryale.AAC.39